MDERTGRDHNRQCACARCAGTTFNIAFYFAYSYAHVTHGRAHAARAPCNARRAPRAGELSAYNRGNVSRGAIRRRRSRHARARGTIRPSARITCKHVDPRCPRGPRLALRRRPLVLGSVRNAHGATQPATAPPPCRQHTLLAPSRPPTAAQLVRAWATLPPTGPDLAPGFHRRERPQLAASIELSLSRSDGSAVLICPRRCA